MSMPADRARANASATSGCGINCPNASKSSHLFVSQAFGVQGDQGAPGNVGKGPVGAGTRQCESIPQCAREPQFSAVRHSPVGEQLIQGLEGEQRLVHVEDECLRSDHALESRRWR